MFYLWFCHIPLPRMNLGPTWWLNWAVLSVKTTFGLAGGNLTQTRNYTTVDHDFWDRIRANLIVSSRCPFLQPN